MFVCQRYGSPNDQTGSKFFFFCPVCNGAVCKSCLVPNEFQLTEIEYTPFHCPRCNTRLYPVKMDNKSKHEAEESIIAFLYGSPGSPKTDVEYSVTVPPKDIRWVSFSSSELLSVNEGLEFRFRADENDFSLIHSRYPEPLSVLFNNGERSEIDRNSLFVNPGFSITADNEGFFLANRGSGNIVVESCGVVRMSAPFETEPGGSRNEPDVTLNAKRTMLVNKLKEISEMGIWDYQFINSEKTEGKDEIHIAGSTDLIYYHIIELYFKKVKFSNLISYFHHPHFELANERLRSQVAMLADGIGDDDFVFSVHTDKGGFNEKRYFVAAKYLFSELIKHS